MRRLHDLVAASIAEANEQERTQKMRSSHETWEQIVDQLFQKIEIVYLLEFALNGSMTFFRGSSMDDDRSSRNQRLTISFGRRTVILKPVLAPEKDTFGFITVRNYPDDSRESLIVCSLSEGWQIPKREVSLRRILSRFLPTKYAPITIEGFHEMLADLVQVHQPIFTFKEEVVYERFSLILDRIIPEKTQNNTLQFLSLTCFREHFAYLKLSSNSLFERGRGRFLIASANSTKLLGVNPDKDQR